MKTIIAILFFLTVSVFGAGVTITNSQVALSTTASLVSARNAERFSILIRNLDASISIYVGAAGVTSSTGVLVKAGEYITISSGAAIYAVAASGTPSIAIFTETK